MDPSSSGPRLAAILTCMDEIQQTLKKGHTEKKILFICMGGLFQQGFHVSALSSGDEIFFCLDIITACVVVVKSLFSYLRKPKNPKAIEVLLD